jgi:hypothetical protein
MHEYGKYFSLTLLNTKCYCSRWPLLPTEIICIIFEVATKGAATESGLPGCHALLTVIGLRDPEEGTTIPPKPAAIYQSALVTSHMT